MPVKYSAGLCMAIVIAWFGMPVYSQDAAQIFKRASEIQTSAPDSAFILAEHSLQLAVAQKNEVLQADINLLLGNIFYEQGAFPSAMDFFLKAFSTYEKTGNRPGLANAHLRLGKVKYYVKQKDQALHDFRLALNEYSHLGDVLHMAEAYGEIGHLYEKWQQYDSAYHYQDKAFEIYQRLDDQAGMARILENLGSIVEDLEDFEKARQYFTRAAAINRKIDNRIELAVNLNNIGDVYRKTNRLDSALHYTNMAVALATELDLVYQRSSALRDIGKIYEQAGDYKLAHDFKEQSRDLFDQVYSQESARQTALLQTLYELESKNAEIIALENKQKINSLTKMGAMATAALLLLLTVVIISRQKLKNRKDREIITQQKRLHDTEIENERLNGEKLRMELEHRQLQEKHLSLELETQQKSLAARMLQLIEKNHLLEEVRDGIRELNVDLPSEKGKRLNQFVLQIDYSFNHDKDWEEFRHSFEQIHTEFFDRLKEINPELTSNDLRICALMRINLRSNEIAPLLGISPDSLRVARYRLRKKLGLSQDHNLRQFILSI